MEKNDSISIASIEKCKEWLVDEDEILEPQHECCIYKVPRDLRKVNEEAYTPQVISIGPLHYGKKELIDMEKQKIRYKREFSKRITVETLQQLIAFVEKHEQYVRRCYEEMPKFRQLDFITMILYDAIFIIELFLRLYENKRDFLLYKGQRRSTIQLDLELVENQLPYFILEELFRLAFSECNPSGGGYPSFFILSCEFLSNSMFNGIPEEVEVKHFVDLRRYVLTKTRPIPSLVVGNINFPCALKLQASGVKFKGIGINVHEGLLDIKLEKRELGIPCLRVRHDELQIPCFEVYDETEFLIRNVMAFEQCHYPCETHFCNYIDLMDALINTEEDVNLLIEAGIINNHVGDNATVANMFNKFGRQIDISPSCFADICKELQAHYEYRWNHAMATLKSVYFSNYWRGTATVAAIVLLVLTLIQTICSILQVV